MNPLFCWENAFLPAAIALFPALYHASKFRGYMPLPEGYETFSRWLFFGLPQMADLAFHEAGHPIVGMLTGGNEFFTAAGGTIFQLGLPLICLGTFWRQRSLAGVVVCLGWIGENLIQISYYMADAKQQVIILITGMSGSEGGMHDWGTMLDTLHLKGFCVGFGQLTFFAGVFLLCFALAYPVGWILRQAGVLALAPGETRLRGD